MLHLREVFKADGSDNLAPYAMQQKQIMVEGTAEVEVLPCAREAAGETVMLKNAWDGFAGTRGRLLQKLIALGVSTCVFAGLATSICVLQTATAAVNHGLLSVIATDACADHMYAHEAVIKRYSGFGGLDCVAVNRAIQRALQLADMYARRAVRADVERLASPAGSVPHASEAGASSSSIGGGITRKASFFRELFGFDEKGLRYDEIQAAFEIEGLEDGGTRAKFVKLHCKKKKRGEGFGIGLFTCPTLAELRAEAAAVKQAGGQAGAPAGGPAGGRAFGGVSVTHSVTHDIMADHADPVNNGALFQAASQFNCLEMVSDSVAPETGVTGYVNDHTQGPACALATAPALVYRNYLLRVERGRLASAPAPRGQTHDRQLNTCADMEELLFEKTGERFWEMRNGYLRSDRGRLAR